MKASRDHLFDFTAADFGQRNFKRRTIPKFRMGARQKPYCHRRLREYGQRDCMQPGHALDCFTDLEVEPVNAIIDRPRYDPVAQPNGKVVILSGAKSFDERVQRQLRHPGTHDFIEFAHTGDSSAKDRRTAQDICNLFG